MKKQIVGVTLLALLALTVAGCQTAKGPSDEELVRQTADVFVKGLVEKNPDTAVSVVSPNFYNADAGDKAGLRTYIADAISSGLLDGAEADLSSVEYTQEAPDKATMYPVVINVDQGTGTLGIHFTKEGGKWMITGMDVEGV